MNLDTINLKRKYITRLSVIISTIIIALGAVSLVLGMYFTLFYILTAIILIGGLYCLSKFLIMPKYEALKIDILNNIVLSNYKNIKVKSSTEKFNYLNNFYDKDKTKKTSKYDFIIDENIYHTATFELMVKSGLKYVNSNEMGRIIKFENKFKNVENCAFISLNHKESEKYVTFLKDEFTNRNDNVTSLRKYKPYVALYNNKIQIEILDIIEEINSFNCIIIKQDYIYIIDNEKNIPFEFKLQDELTNNKLIDCRNSINNLVKVLTKIEKVRKEN